MADDLETFRKAHQATIEEYQRERMRMLGLALSLFKILGFSFLDPSDSVGSLLLSNLRATMFFKSIVYAQIVQYIIMKHYNKQDHTVTNLSYNCIG